MDINEITSKIVTEAMESEDEFIFTTIKPWCEEKIQRKISKRDLENALSMYFDIDKEDVFKAVILLDLFTKTYCRYRNDYERFDDSKFRCGECPFKQEDGTCLVKTFKNKYAPNYRDFGSMGDL